MFLPRPLLPIALATLGLASCAGRSRWPIFSTQQWPGPMRATVDPLPPGIEARYAPGPEEVVIRRLADPVQVKLAGQPAAFRLRYFDKRRRANAGTWVFCSAGGRAEVLWPDTGSTIVLHDFCTGVVGSPSRGEPNFVFREVQRAVLLMNPGDQIELLGGALLSANAGPWLLERQSFEILRVKNQSKEGGEVAYRNEVFQIGPGQEVDLPLLPSGGAPIPDVPGTLTYQGPGFGLRAFGGVRVAHLEGGLQVTGEGEHEIEALGVRLHLAPGESARFLGLGPAGAALQEEGDHREAPDPSVSEPANPPHSVPPETPKTD